jgi:ribosomal protein S27E
MRKIKLANGTTVEVECLSCALTAEELIKPTGGIFGFLGLI